MRARNFTAAIVEEVVGVFQEQYSVWAALGREGLLNGDGAVMSADVSGAVETLTKKEPIGAFSYYAVGMSTMFVLFIASGVGGGSYQEKKWNVYDRVILSNIPSWAYVISIFFSAFLVVFCQLGILFLGADLFYGVRMPDITAFICVTLALCAAVGGIAVLLMAMNFRLNSEAPSKLFMSGFVAVLAFIGGSFTPVGQMSETMAKIGNLSPNGAAMSAYLDVLQGAGVTEVTNHIFVMLILAAVLSVIGWLVFPRKVGAE